MPGKLTGKKVAVPGGTHPRPYDEGTLVTGRFDHTVPLPVIRVPNDLPEFCQEIIAALSA